jgi:RHS repeat-associated protein
MTKIPTSYDAIGNMATSTDFNGQTITYSYDAMNRLKTKQLGVNNSVTYTYTLNGQLNSTVDTRGTTSYNYDQRDRLIKQTETDGQTLQYTYDKASNRTSITTQTGTTNYGYNRYNELTTVTDKNGGVTTYTYDKAENRTKIQMADGTVETRNYDLLNHLIKQETSNSTGVIAGYTYTLDAGGKKVELLENNGRKVNYAYDKLDRLLTEQIIDGTNGNRTTGYVYDPIGNRVSKTDSVAGVTSYVYDNNDRLLTETNGSKVTTSTYDNNGNNLTRGDGSSQTTNTWDIEHRLIQSITDASSTQYQYEPNGVRVSSKTAGVETRYLVDSNRPHAQVMMEYDVNGNSIVDYTYGISLISQQRSSVTAFYHADGLGSTRFLTDSLGTVTDAYVYDAYGNTLSSSGTTVNNYLYTGEQFDKNLGEYYLRARYYNPSQGRFTGRDPFEGMLEEPLSLNKYGYVHGNPINNTDPTGMFAMSMGDISTALAIVGLLAVGGIAGYNVYTGVRSLSGTAGNLGGSNSGSNSSSLPTKIKLALLLSLLTSITITGDSTSEDRTDFPIVYYGDFAKNGVRGIQSIRKTSEHIREAIFTKSPVVLAYKQIPKTTWYTRMLECNTRAKTEFSRKNSSPGNRDEGNCDEYPFFKTEQGGPTNYSPTGGIVSLKLVPLAEATVQGTLMNVSEKNLGIISGDPDKKWYGVVSLPGILPLSFWKKSDGSISY